MARLHAAPSPTTSVKVGQSSRGGRKLRAADLVIEDLHICLAAFIHHLGIEDVAPHLSNRRTAAGSSAELGMSMCAGKRYVVRRQRAAANAHL